MHPAETIWRALLDGEVETLRVTVLQEHLNGCEVCQQAVEALRRDRTTVRTLLGVLDEPASPPSVDRFLQRARRRRPRHWSLIAAMILLSLATVAGATMGAGIFRTAVEKIRRAPAPDPKPNRIAHIEGAASTGISLETREAADIVFISAQGGGTLTIQEGDRTSVEIVATAPVPYTVRAGRVTVANGGPTASYQVTLPRGILRADVWVAGQVLFSKRGSVIRAAVKPDKRGKYVLPFP